MELHIFFSMFGDIQHWFLCDIERCLGEAITYFINTTKTHGSVSYGLRKQGVCNTVSILTGRTKSQFSHLFSSMMSLQNGTKFIVEVTSMPGRPQLKFEENFFSNTWDISQQIFIKKLFFSSFCTLKKLANAYSYMTEIWSTY